ncbi:hypothetical protein [Pelosinus propionicus]|uniref:Iron complex outermembrane recepter protein n=1 Tax=Pelosinus propionicus DSM 13327 TaxID=1123291 RepID=A0A1I4N8S0_9FIRM|nr:hypothetical protein [Pelosinus propionicus]SFM11962.1 iron complex outermembrane recepter protein [Pelosinus propionicus DSM 13327]
MKTISRTRKSLLSALLSSSLLWHLPMAVHAADDIVSPPEQAAIEADSSQREFILEGIEVTDERL